MEGRRGVEWEYCVALNGMGTEKRETLGHFHINVRVMPNAQDAILAKGRMGAFCCIS